MTPSEFRDLLEQAEHDRVMYAAKPVDDPETYPTIRAMGKEYHYLRTETLMDTEFCLVQDDTHHVIFIKASFCSLGYRL